VARFWLPALALLLAVPAGAQIGRRPARPQVDRPDGPVWNVIRKNCISCHGIDDYAFFALDKAGWHELLASKHKAGGYALADADRELLLGWLAERFGPESKPFPRTYVPPEITTFFSDPEGFRLLDRACTKCHGRERIDQVRYPEERWRVTLVDMRERGAEISDEELEQLVEWLTRVRGTNQGN
jgi:mono/diheme cytochrome c family protein